MYMYAYMCAAVAFETCSPHLTSSRTRQTHTHSASAINSYDLIEWKWRQRKLLSILFLCQPLSPLTPLSSVSFMYEKGMKIYYIPQNIKSEHIAMKVLLLLLLLACLLLLLLWRVLNQYEIWLSFTHSSSSVAAVSLLLLLFGFNMLFRKICDKHY